MRKFVRHNKLTTIVLILTLAMLTQGFACSKDKARTFSKATDDTAQAQIGAANLVKTARETNLISESDKNVLKEALLAVNSANEEAINLSKSLSTGDITPDEQTSLLNAIKKVSDSIVRLNNEGLLRIKDPAKRAAFSGFVLAMQAAVSSVVVILVKK